jgi:hypothetical protein
MKAPHDPRHNKVTGLDERSCNDGKCRGDEPDNDEACLAGMIFCGCGFAFQLLTATRLRGLPLIWNLESRRCAKRVNHKPPATIVCGDGEVFEYWVATKYLKHIEYVMSVIRQGEGMDDGVVMDSKHC